MSAEAHTGHTEPPVGSNTIDPEVLTECHGGTKAFEQEAPPTSAQVNVRHPSVRRWLGFRQVHIGAVGLAEDVIHYGVAVVLMGVAAIVLYRTTYTLITTSEPFDQAATTAVNGVLFAIIIMEVMRTVMAHFDRGGLQLQPFLIIGIISAVREILSVGAHLSLAGSTRSDVASTVRLALLELAVNAGVVVGLALALVLIRRLAGMRDD
jgi:uncharacterized membrane protein (DUF373 family)